MRDDDRPSVEFLVSAPDNGADDEDLVLSEGFPRLRRARLPLIVAGAIGLLALVVVSVVKGPSGSPSAAPATVTVAPSPTTSAPIAGGPAQRRSGSVVLPDGSCPPDASCAVLFTTPRRVASAVHDALPTARRLRTVTTTMRDAPVERLVSRTISGRVGNARLTVTLAAAGRHDRIGWNASEDATRTLVTATHHLGGRLVTVRLTAPPGYEVGIATVRGLAADPRLARLT